MGRPVAIEVRDLHKRFRIPDDARGRARIRNLLGGGGGRDLEVLRDVSFDIEAGEFFGIVGRNGSGKSTLLKLLASIYRADRGTIRVAGRLAPFLELGVGFNPELAAYDNVVLNGVMMGLRPAQARERFEQIVDFAGLEGATDLKLKNYSSGMKVRLGFAIMTHVDADVLLIDEVLAVGDAEFQEKCGEVFRRMHDEGRTMVLVTHSMPAVLAFCERAMLLHDGRIERLGEPEEVTERYIELNMRALADRSEEESTFASRTAAALMDPVARVTGARLASGVLEGRIVTLARGEAIELEGTVQLDGPVEDPRLYLRLENSRGHIVYVAGGDELGVPLGLAGRPGETAPLRLSLENRLAGGRYLLTCAVLRLGEDGSPEPAGPPSTLRFEVPGTDRGGLVELEHRLDVAVGESREALHR